MTRKQTSVLISALSISLTSFMSAREPPWSFLAIIFFMASIVNIWLVVNEAGK